MVEINYKTKQILIFREKSSKQEYRQIYFDIKKACEEWKFKVKFIEE